MRRDKLDRVIKAINYKTPKWRYRRCDQCADDVKGEQMWWFKRYARSTFGYPTLCYKTWTCFKCAPKMSDLIVAHRAYFADHYGEIDLTSILDEEEEMRGWS